MKNTLLRYQYRDAGGNKIACEEILPGRLAPKKMEAFNREHDGDWFYPQKLNLPAPTFIDYGFKPNENDVNYHVFVALEKTDRQPSVSSLPIRTFVRDFSTAKHEF